MRMVWCLLAFGVLELSSIQLHAGAAPSSAPLLPAGAAATPPPRSWRVSGAYVRNSALSDHLPVVVDLAMMDAVA